MKAILIKGFGMLNPIKDYPYIKVRLDRHLYISNNPAYLVPNTLLYRLL